MTNIIAYPSEKGGYNTTEGGVAGDPIIAYPSEKGGYNETRIYSL